MVFYSLHNTACVPVDESSSQAGLTQAEGHCSSLCERLMNLVVGCSELVQSAVSPGPPTEGLLKVCLPPPSMYGYSRMVVFGFHQCMGIIDW